MTCPIGPVTSAGLGGAGAATQAAFWSAVNSLSSDPNFYWDNTNKYLGVGTSIPAARLDVNGGTYLRDTSYILGSKIFYATDGSKYLGFSCSSSVGNLGMSDTSTLSLQANGGYIGIGTNSPQQLTHIYGGASGVAPPFALSGQLLVENSNDAGIYVGSPDNNYGRLVFATPSSNNGGVLRWDYTNKIFVIGTELVGGILTFVTANFSERMRIDAAGKVGIGTASPNQLLEVNGRVRVDTRTADGTNVAYFNAAGDLGLVSSDRRLKKNIEPLKDALETVKKITGVKFEWKDQKKGVGRQVGIIAQDVVEAIPELSFKTGEHDEDGSPYYSIHYERLTALLIEAVKELSGKVEKLEKQLAAATDPLKDVVTD